MSGVGAIAGGLLVLTLQWLRGPSVAGDVLAETAVALKGLMLDTAPALLIAFVAAGLVSAFLAPQRMAWMSLGSPLRQATSGMLVGLPLPVCSCGVVPLYQGLLRQGVAPTAALAFLVATPELGLDAILLSWPLLGGPLSVVRVLAAVIAALTVALVLGRHRQHALLARALPPAPPQTATSNGEKLRHAMRVGLVEMVDHTAPWIVLGVVVAAVLAPVLEHSWITRLPPGLDVIAFALAGLPLYVCASASTPLVAVLVAAGVSPGAGLALLITGPATNVGTLGILTRLHSRRFALQFGALMFTVSVLLGWATNLLLPSAPIAVANTSLVPRDGTFLELAAVALLAGLFLLSLLRQGPRGFLAELRFTRAT